MRLLCRLLPLLVLAGPAPALAAAPVSGRLASPAGQLPALTVFAWSLSGAKLYSVTTDAGQATFALKLPAGRYFVFAAPLDPAAPAVYGAYTEHAACAGDAGRGGCAGHALKVLAVGRRAAPVVELTDWYLDDAITQQLDAILGRRSAGAPAEAELGAPRFSEYPAIVTTQARASALAGGDEPRIEHDREPLAAALASPVNFAGRTVLVRLGCGAGCESVALVDAPTGRVAYPVSLAQLPPAGACAPAEVLRFRRDSRLLTVTGASEHGRVTRYFVWDPERGALKLIASLSSAVEGCAAAR